MLLSAGPVNFPGTGPEERREPMVHTTEALARERHNDLLREAAAARRAHEARAVRHASIPSAHARAPRDETGGLGLMALIDAARRLARGLGRRGAPYEREPCS